MLCRVLRQRGGGRRRGGWEREREAWEEEEEGETETGRTRGTQVAKHNLSDFIPEILGKKGALNPKPSTFNPKP